MERCKLGQGADRDESVHRTQRLQEFVLRRIVDSPHVARDPEVMHREEHQVEEHEGQPKVNLAKQRTHQPTEHLRIPVGIPVFRLAQAESEKLMRMEEELKLSVVGQDEAVSTVTRSIRRTRAGLSTRK